MQPVLHADGEIEAGIGAGFFCHVDVVDVGAFVGDGCRHLGQYAALVGDDDAEADVEQFVEFG